MPFGVEKSKDVVDVGPGLEDHAFGLRALVVALVMVLNQFSSPLIIVSVSSLPSDETGGLTWGRTPALLDPVSLAPSYWT